MTLPHEVNERSTAVRMRICRWLLPCLLVWIMILPEAVWAQEAAPDTLQADPATPAAIDTLLHLPAIPGPSPTAEATRSGIPPDVESRHADGRRASPAGSRRSGEGDEQQEGVVYFASEDSLVVTFDGEEGDVGRLKGQASVRYNRSRMTAHEIDLIFNKDEMRARADASGPRLRNIPKFQEEGSNDSFEGSELAYNFRTERGRVLRGLSEIEDGFVRAEVTRIQDDRTIFVKDGSYTTDPVPIDETPSYSLRASEMKIVDNEWIYTGPIQLYIFNIPTPLWLPFGFLPASDSRRSGPLPPNYGEDERGFYLRDFGWYWAMNDLMDFQIRGGIWTSGSWRINPRFRYNRRDMYDGQANFEMERSQRGEQHDPNFVQTERIRLRWQHRQDINPTSSFNANVDLTTPGFLRQSDQEFRDRVSQTASSSITYRKNWRAVGRSVTVSANQRQTFNTGEATITLPDINFRQSQFRPFQRSERPPGAGEAWYERINLQYRGNLRNRFDFTPISDEELIARGDTTAAGDPIDPNISWYEALFSPSAFREGTGEEIPFDLRASHSIPVSANFSVNRLPLIGPINLNFTPQFSYDEDWFVATERRRFDEEEGRVVREQVSDFHALRQFSTGISMNTTVFGTFPMRVGSFDGLRHTMRPNVSFSYQPDFSSGRFGNTRTFERPVAGEEDEVEEVRYPIVRGVRSGEQRSLSFSLNNTFETRRVTVVDTTGERRTDSVQLLTLNASSGYNFAADEFALSDISLTARIPITNRVSINSRATISPYQLNEERTSRIDELLFDPLRLKFGRLTRISANTNFRLSGGEGAGAGAAPTRGGRPGAGGPPEAAQQQARQTGPPGADARAGVDPGMEQPAAGDRSIPWSVNFSLSYSLNRSTPQRTTRTARVNSQFNVGLTPKWRISGNTGYDFVEWELSQTQIQVFRDLGAWELSFNWVPFGRFESYGFTLQVKSGRLRDLLRLDEPSRDGGGRFDGLTGAGTSPF